MSPKSRERWGDSEVVLESTGRSAPVEERAILEIIVGCRIQKVELGAVEADEEAPGAVPARARTRAPRRVTVSGRPANGVGPRPSKEPYPYCCREANSATGYLPVGQDPEIGPCSFRAVGVEPLLFIDVGEQELQPHIEAGDSRMDDRSVNPEIELHILLVVVGRRFAGNLVLILTLTKTDRGLPTTIDRTVVLVWQAQRGRRG